MKEHWIVGWFILRHIRNDLSWHAMWMGTRALATVAQFRCHWFYMTALFLWWVYVHLSLFHASNRKLLFFITYPPPPCGIHTHHLLSKIEYMHCSCQSNSIISKIRNIYLYLMFMKRTNHPILCVSQNKENCAWLLTTLSGSTRAIIWFCSFESNDDDGISSIYGIHKWTLINTPEMGSISYFDWALPNYRRRKSHDGKIGSVGGISRKR